MTAHVRIALVIAFALMLAPTGAQAAEREVIKHYVGAPASAGLVFCGAPRPAVDGVGRVCYLRVPAETTIAVKLFDATGLPLAGRALFFGEETGIGEPLDIVGSASFCGTLPTTVMPSAATHLDIEVGDRLDDPTLPCGTTTAGTWGAVVATFN